MSSNYNDLLQKHLEAWGERDTVRRRKLIDAIYSEHCYYVDPLDQIEGRNGIEGLIERLQAQFPGFIFRMDGPIDTHHHIARFTWCFGPPDSVAVRGVDVVVFENGLIRSMYGFFETPEK
ncbi:nuclear transport factor 2 family protein [Paenibacillus sp. P26]|nr:nuclear transport factor 2 family protein [Paenibacillus sp. P26]UUZ91885.1 nuclear transport factor 2 family protein [Paenibacillus sp. P25]